MIQVIKTVSISIAILILCGINENSFASPPNISGVSGEISQKKSVRINGNNFGSKQNGSPLKYDNFESGSVGVPVMGEGSGGWETTTARGSSYAPSYSTGKVRYNGTQSLYQNFTNGNYTNYIKLSQNTIPSGTRRLYVSGWFNLETGGAPSRNTKILNMGACNSWQTRLDIYPSNGSGHLYANDGRYQDWGARVDRVFKNDGHWHRLEGWLDLGKGYRDVSMDLRRVAQISGNFVSSSCGLTYLLIGHYFATDTGSPKPWAKRYWDEIYVDTTQARIEIGDNADWDRCSHREIQIPTSWSNSSIEFRVNQGTFNNGATNYLFVVNESGEISGGYKVTFGQSENDDNNSDNQDAIDAPTNLRIVESN